jgi:hypothetical protein
MRRILTMAALAPMMALAPAPASANVGICYIQWFDSVAACGGQEPCSSRADAELMQCLAREVTVNQ